MPCPSCGLGTAGDTLCAWHTYQSSAVERDTWAESNRKLCDYLHRGVPLARLPKAEREDYLSAPVDPHGWMA